MSEIKIIDTGLIYKNPIPHVKSEHAYFPSVVTMDNGEMLATIVLGEAFEAANNHTHICRSKDSGKTWQIEGAVYERATDRITSDFSRLTALSNGELVIFMMRSDRTDHPNEGLTNPDTLGFVSTELLLLRSKDYGHVWSCPEPLDPPLVGPSFEICCPITVLSDGRWVIPTETWPGWDGDCPNGIHMVGLVSNDKGESWQEYMDVMNEEGKNVYFWESKIIELIDGKLLAVAWVYDDDAKCDRPNHYALSNDGGETWNPPKSMGLHGQTLTPYLLEDGRILCVYRRMDIPGLWGAVCRLEGQNWSIESQTPLWGDKTTGLASTSENMSQNFNALKFGAPCITKTPEGEILVAFWCYEDCVSIIRWFKLELQR